MDHDRCDPLYVRGLVVGREKPVQSGDEQHTAFQTHQLVSTHFVLALDDEQFLCTSYNDQMMIFADKYSHFGCRGAERQQPHLQTRYFSTVLPRRSRLVRYPRIGIQSHLLCMEYGHLNSLPAGAKVWPANNFKMQFVILAEPDSKKTSIGFCRKTSDHLCTALI